MPKVKAIESVNKKGRILYVLKLLYEQTDESHPMSTNEIIDWFAKRGVEVNRKTVRNDMETLIAAGYDIEIMRSTSSLFYMSEREFELPELKLLIDAVTSSRFITDDKSRKMVRKLTKFASNYQASGLARHLYTAGRVKPSNEKIYYIVDAISDAINSRKQVSFRYQEYTPEKNKVLRNGGEVYVNSPYALFWNNDYYYMIGYSEKHESIVQFRVDRMTDTKVLRTDAIPAPAGFNAADYGREVFEMFSGEEITVSLQCDNELMKTIIDKFGENAETRIYSPECFIAKVKVAASPIFYGWVFQFGGKIRIQGPAGVRKNYREMLRSALGE